MEDRYAPDGAPYLAEDIPGYLDTLRVCVDCRYWIEYGPEDPHGYYGEGYAGPEVLAARLAADGLTLAEVDAEDARTVWDPSVGEAYAPVGFSWSPCRGCGSGLGGDRVTVDLYRRVPVPVTLTAAGRAEVEG